ncbi:hypothetical protein SAMN05216381_2456 [Pseudomonas seleniipraecipitans]|uniref:Uncharacterized protein n=1 Tax=Phytopseudomonas seleniipraecipitans TaxID=640205 RepID=A0A1G7P8M1_9GAMM|nr:hypothetical protein SAMN05216381_2456 [Pseudomonas seleniipraecipitans]
MSIPVRMSFIALPAQCLRLRAPEPTGLPQTLAFWALWHCRHARPPDTLLVLG